MGAQVHLYDAMKGAARAGVTKIARNLDKGVELGKLEAADRDAALARLAPFDELTPACSEKLWKLARYARSRCRCAVTSSASGVIPMLFQASSTASWGLAFASSWVAMIWTISGLPAAS